MAQTVIGIFDNSNQAQNAVEQLVSSGISRDNIDLATSSTSGSTTDSYQDNDSSNDGISGFFSSLFGGDDDANKYSHVARRGSTVTVHTQSREEAERAADLLDQYGAVDVDEQASRYGYTGSSSGLGAGAATTGMGMASSGMGTDTVRTGMGATNMGMGTTDLTPSGSTSTGMGSVNMNTGASDLASGSTGTGYTNSDSDLNTTDLNRNNLNTDINRDNLNTDQSIPIIEENLQVGKREVETGGVRVRSRIIERPVEEHLRLREEHVHIQRNPVNRPLSDADLNNFREGTIEMTEHAEVPVVNKEARVVEEVTLGKEVTERDEVVSDTVRKTEVDIDNLGTTSNSLNTGTTNDYLSDDDRLNNDSDRGRTSGL